MHLLSRALPVTLTPERPCQQSHSASPPCFLSSSVTVPTPLSLQGSARRPGTPPRLSSCCHLASHPQDGGAADPHPRLLSATPSSLPGAPSSTVHLGAPAAGLGPGSCCSLLPRAGGPGRTLAMPPTPLPPPFPGLHLLLTINLRAFSCSTTSAGSIIAVGH